MRRALASVVVIFCVHAVVSVPAPAAPFTREFKPYAPGIGPVQDGALRLVEHGIDR